MERRADVSDNNYNWTALLESLLSTARRREEIIVMTRWEVREVREVSHADTSECQHIA